MFSSFSLRRSKTSSRLACFCLLYNHLASVAAEVVLYGHSELPQNLLKLPREQECPVSANGLTSTSFPWTHNPTCIHDIALGDGQSTETVCVYTNSRFANGRGISLVTTPEVATSYVLESFSHEDQEDHGHESYKTQKSPLGGVGTFAKKNISPGDTIMMKHPILMVSRDVLHGHARQERHKLLKLAVRQLPEKTQAALKGMAKSRGGDELDDIVQTNAMGMRIGRDLSHLGLVPEIAKINHACRGNSFYRFDDYTLTLELIAIKDIEKGEELTYSYGFSDQPHASRTASLKEHWGFTCTCPLCSSPRNISASDKRLEDIASMKQVLPTGWDSIPKLIALLPPLIKLMDEEDLIVEKPAYEEILAYAWSTLGHEDKARYWAERARKGWQIVAGRESWEARRTGELEGDVRGHPTFGTWDKDPWDDSVWEDDDHEHEHEHEHEH